MTMRGCSKGAGFNTAFLKFEVQDKFEEVYCDESKPGGAKAKFWVLCRDVAHEQATKSICL
jgi:hypothetical protein